MDCEGEASISVFVSVYVVVKSTWWWPKSAKTCSRWLLNVWCSKISVYSDNKYRHWLTNTKGWWYQRKLMGLNFFSMCIERFNIALISRQWRDVGGCGRYHFINNSATRSTATSTTTTTTTTTTAALDTVTNTCKTCMQKIKGCTCMSIGVQRTEFANFGRYSEGCFKSETSSCGAVSLCCWHVFHRLFITALFYIFRCCQLNVWQNLYQTF